MTDLEKWCEEEFKKKRPGDPQPNYANGFQDGFEKALKFVYFKLEQRRRAGPCILDREIFEWVKKLGKSQVMKEIK